MTVTLMTAKPRNGIKILSLYSALAAQCLLNSAAADNSVIDEFESIELIESTAEKFALNALEPKNLTDLAVSASALDSRLRLKKCNMPLEAFSNRVDLLNTRSTIGVRCNGESPWTLYVPITVHALTPVVYTNKPLLRGEKIDENGVELRFQPLDRVPSNSLTNISQILGMEAARAVPADMALSLSALRSAKLISQGQEVIIMAEGSGLAVRMSGNALKNGAKGEVIPVKNLSSGRVLEGRIVSDNTVLVGF